MQYRWINLNTLIYTNKTKLCELNKVEIALLSTIIADVYIFKLLIKGIHILSPFKI